MYLDIFENIPPPNIFKKNTITSSQIKYICKEEDTTINNNSPLNNVQHYNTGGGVQLSYQACGKQNLT